MRCDDISVRYGQHRALQDVSVTVATGEIVVILGANGAGKIDAAARHRGICEGVVPARSGSMDTRPDAASAPTRSSEAGLALVPEGRGIFGDLTVRENLTLGAYSPTRPRRREQATSTASMACSPSCRNAAARSPAPCRAASSRWSRSAAR